MRDLIYHRLAQLLVRSRGSYAVEIARKRAVACRLMGNEVESQHWSRLRCDAEVLLRQREARLPSVQSAHAAPLSVFFLFSRD